MSNPDKHKPLSAEELFKLLENKSDNATDFEDMDDFEKEALEGFTTHSTPQKAKTLTEELNLEISKRVEETGKGGAKNKIIWFSAAASIALIILVSVFFFNQSKQDSGNNLALKEVTEENKPSTATEQNTVLETLTKDNVILEEHKEQESTKPQAVVNTKNAEEITPSGIIAEPSMAISENKLSSLSGETGSKDESKNRRESDVDALQKQASVLKDKTDVKKEEKSSVEQEEVATGYATNQNVTTTTATKEEADKNYKLDEAKDFKKTKNLEQASEEKAVSTKSNDNSISYAKTAPAPSSVSTSEVNNNAYYTGSELAINEFVLSYLKSKQNSKIISGKYKVVGKVNVKGELSVSEIKQISKEDCNCTELIKEALNTMNKWHPAVQNGKAATSNVEFTLMF